MINRKSALKSSERLTLPILSESESRSNLPSKLKPGLEDSGNHIIQDWLKTSNVPRIINYRFPSEKYTTPATTSQDIGWPWIPRTSANPNKVNTGVSYKRECNPEAKSLEIFGREGRRKGDVFKWFGAREALP
jgi:hypothetical protein